MTTIPAATHPLRTVQRMEPDIPCGGVYLVLSPCGHRLKHYPLADMTGAHLSCPCCTYELALRAAVQR